MRFLAKVLLLELCSLKKMGTGYKFKVTWGNVALDELTINGESVDVIAGVSLKAGFAILHDKK